MDLVLALLAIIAAASTGIITHVLARGKIQQIHVMVNSQKKEADARIAALEHKLGIKAGEEI